jgi:hypothetical protein
MDAIYHTALRYRHLQEGQNQPEKCVIHLRKGQNKPAKCFAHLREGQNKPEKGFRQTTHRNLHGKYGEKLISDIIIILNFEQYINGKI